MCWYSMRFAEVCQFGNNQFHKGLVTNYGVGGGGTKKGKGGHDKFYPYEKGGGGKRFSHADRGAQKVLR